MSDTYTADSPYSYGNTSDYNADVDEVDETDPETDESATQDEPGSTAKRGTRSGGRSTSRALVRRIAAKAEQVVAANSDTVELAASLAGSGTGVAELTTAIMTSDRSVTQPISDLEMIADSDPMEAGVNAAALGKPRLRAVWSLLAGLDAVSGGAMPSSDAKAAIAVAKAAHELDQSTKDRMAEVAGLLKKS